MRVISWDILDSDMIQAFQARCISQLSVIRLISQIVKNILNIVRIPNGTVIISKLRMSVIRMEGHQDRQFIGIVQVMAKLFTQFIPMERALIAMVSINP